MIFKFYLPQISRILALRRKTMGFSQDGMTHLQHENQQVRENYEMLFSKALATSKSVFNYFFSRTLDWLNTNATSITKTQYQKINSSYIESLGETSLSQNMLFYHAAPNFPQRLSFKILLNTLENFNLKVAAGEKPQISLQETQKSKKTKK
jgi:hypothetical protein